MVRTGYVSFVLIACGVMGIALAGGARGESRGLENAPPNLIATDAKLDDVIARMHVADPEPTGSYRQQWKIDASGLSGTDAIVRSGSDYWEETRLGPFSQTEGKYRGQRWHTNENGQVLLTTGVHERDTITHDVLQQQHFDSSDGVALLGEDPALRAFVVAVAPKDGRKEWLFVDAMSGHVVREEDIYGQQRQITQYADFRAEAGGPAIAHRVSWAYSDGREPGSETLVSEVEGTGSADLRIPADARHLIEFPAGATRVVLPATFVRGHVVVRITIGGRGLDCLLDSGAGAIFLTEKVARELQLPIYGASLALGAGPVRMSRTIVPKIAVGALTMHDVAVWTVPGDIQMSRDIDTVCILGFDFINSAAIRIDYENRKVEAIASDAFDANAITDSFALPAALDDGVPLIPVAIGGATSRRFMLDTGSDNTIVFSRFAREHPDDVVDVKGMLRRVGSIAIGHTEGGNVVMAPTELKSVTLGKVRFVEFMSFRSLDAGNFEGDDSDGLIGGSMLQFFDLYFDYAHREIVFVPNGLLRRSLVR